MLPAAASPSGAPAVRGLLDEHGCLYVGRDAHRQALVCAASKEWRAWRFAG